VNFQATRGAKIDIKTTSFYAAGSLVGDRRLTLDLGTRFEVVRSNATGDIQAVDTAKIVPRLGAVFALDEERQDDGPGQLRALYSGKYGQVQFSANSNVSRRARSTTSTPDPRGRGAALRPPRFRPTTPPSCSRASRPRTCKRWAKGLAVADRPAKGTSAWPSARSKQGHAEGDYVCARRDFVEDFAC